MSWIACTSIFRFLMDLECRIEKSILISDVCDIVYNHAVRHFGVFIKYVINQRYQENNYRRILWVSYLNFVSVKMHVITLRWNVLNTINNFLRKLFKSYIWNSVVYYLNVQTESHRLSQGKLASGEGSNKWLIKDFDKERPQKSGYLEPTSKTDLIEVEQPPQMLSDLLGPLRSVG